MFKKTGFFLAEIAIIVLLYQVPVYNAWFHERILTPRFSFDQQLKHLGLEERKEARYGHSYIVYKDIVRDLTGIKNTVILLPPNEYLREMGIAGLEMVEPALFYYYTGVNSVTAYSPNAGAAGWALITKGYGNIWLKKINTKPQLDSLLEIYKKYKN